MELWQNKTPHLALVRAATTLQKPHLEILRFKGSTGGGNGECIIECANKRSNHIYLINTRKTDIRSDLFNCVYLRIQTEPFKKGVLCFLRVAPAVLSVHYKEQWLLYRRTVVIYNCDTNCVSSWVYLSCALSKKGHLKSAVFCMSLWII